MVLGPALDRLLGDGFALFVDEGQVTDGALNSLFELFGDDGHFVGFSAVLLNFCHQKVVGFSAGLPIAIHARVAAFKGFHVEVLLG